MRTLRWLMTAVVLTAGGASGCVAADLGDAPLFCNKWEPRCPEGYVCVVRQGDEICAREGQALTHAAKDGGPTASQDGGF